jgi:hypothetical protein
MSHNSSPLKWHRSASDALISRVLRHYRYQMLLPEPKRGVRCDFICHVHDIGYKYART